MPKTRRAPDPTDVTPGENSLRWWVRSRTGNGRYLVDLASYDGAGRCCCPHYQIHIEPLVRRGVSPEEAIERNLLKLEPWQAGPWEAFTCYHQFRAWNELARAFVRRVMQTGQGR